MYYIVAIGKMPLGGIGKLQGNKKMTGYVKPFWCLTQNQGVLAEVQECGLSWPGSGLSLNSQLTALGVSFCLVQPLPVSS